MNSHVHLNKRAGVPNPLSLSSTRQIQIPSSESYSTAGFWGGEASILRLIYQLNDIGRKQVTGTM
jgi:hypothetical protein